MRCFRTLVVLEMAARKEVVVVAVTAVVVAAVAKVMDHASSPEAEEDDDRNVNLSKALPMDQLRVGRAIDMDHLLLAVA